MADQGPRIQVWDWAGVEDPYNPGMDFPTAWAIQNEIGVTLDHDSRCSFVVAAMLCDCGALGREHSRRKEDKGDD